MASVVGFGIPFIQSFLFAVLLSDDDYGRLVFFLSIFGMLSAFFGFGIGTLIQRYYYDKPEKELLRETFSFWLICGVVLTIVFLIVGKILFLLYDDLPFNFISYILIVLGAFLFSINLTFLNIYIVGKRPIKYAIHLILGRLLLFLSLLTVYLFFNLNMSNFILAYTVSSFLIFVLTLLEFKINPFRKILFKPAREFFLFSYPLMINSIGGIGYTHGYKILLKLFLSYSELGIFNIASTLANSYYLVSSSLLKGYIPNAFEYLKQNSYERNIPFYRKKILIISATSFLVFLPVTYIFLLYFKGGIYIKAMYIIPILLVAQMILLMYGEKNLMILYHKKTKFITIAVLSGSIISVIFLFLFMNINTALFFAALPISIGYLVQYLIASKLSKKV